MDSIWLDELGMHHRNVVIIYGAALSSHLYIVFSKFIQISTL